MDDITSFWAEASLVSQTMVPPGFVEITSGLISFSTPASGWFRHRRLLRPRDSMPRSCRAPTPSRLLQPPPPRLVDQYLGLHFPASGLGSVDPILGHPCAPEHALRFPQRVAKMLAEAALTGRGGNLRALDIGCAVGGSSFELAASGFKEVLGIDFSSAFINAANRMIEGELETEITAAHEANVDAEVRQRVTFRTGDACRLKDEVEELGQFDGALLAHLLCRLPDPVACLDGLSVLLRPGAAGCSGHPHAFLLAGGLHPEAKWLGGFMDPITQTQVRSKDQLKKLMEERGFAKIGEQQVPLLIREHQRKYQYIVSEATIWRKK